MKPRTRWFAACLVLPCFAALCAPPQSLPEVPASTLVTVRKAMAQADIPTLAKLYQKPPDPVTRVLAAMAIERIHYNLERADHDAAICEHALIDSQPRVALFCARFRIGDAALAQGMPAARRAAAAVAERFRDKVPPAALAAMTRFVASHESQPALGLQRPAGRFPIPLRYTPRQSTPELEVRANGHSAMLMVDTGSSFLALGPALAERLGVRTLDAHGVTNGFFSHGVKATYGVLDTLRFGDVVMRNVPVEVIPGHVHLFGIDLLRQLGTFRLSRKALTVYGDGDPLPACRQPLLVGSGLYGPGVRVVKAIPVDGVLRMTLIDSGASAYFSGDHVAMQRLHAYHNQRVRLRDIGPRVHAARRDEAEARVILAGQPFKLTFGVFEDAHLRWHYILGNGALADMDFFFDFRGHHSCLLLHPDLH